MRILDILTRAHAEGASDVHLKVGNHPLIRLHGSLVPLTDYPTLTAETTRALANEVLSEDQQRKFAQRHDLDFAYSLSGVARFRCNVFQQRGSTGIVLRVIRMDIRSFEELRLPPVIREIADVERGLVLVTGTTTSGKSTTIAAMLDHINRTRRCHIVTIEDPIEYLHRDQQAIINQREVAVDTDSFGSALRAALRQDPDVILVGEMRDAETIETALLAAETGHLVYSTLHTLDATETIHRVIGSFAPHHQAQIRLQLAGVLKAAISMRLLRRADGEGLCPATEVMVSTPYIRECIVDPDRTSLIPGAIGSGRHPYGMQTFDQSIFALLKQELVSYDEAIRYATNVEDFKLLVQGVRRGTAGEEGTSDPDDAPEIMRYSR
jgi:twitching motility protein PilT